MMKKGKPESSIWRKCAKPSEAEQDAGLKSLAQALRRRSASWKVTAHLFSVAAGANPAFGRCDALPGVFRSLPLLAVVCATAARKALATADQEAEIRFYSGKIFTCRYFFGYELPKIEGLAARLLCSDGLTLEMQDVHFC